MDETDAGRRRFLTHVATGAAVAVGGCLGSSEQATTSETATDEVTGTPTEDPTETPTETETQTEQATEDETQGSAMSTVFHFSGDASAQTHAVANVSNLLNDQSVDLGTVALVANGRGIKLLMEGDSKVAGKVRSLLDDGVEFYACHNSMEAFEYTESDLVDPAIEVVPAGVGTLTELQAAEGYAYIETP